MVSYVNHPGREGAPWYILWHRVATMSLDLLGLLKGGLAEIQRCTCCRELTVPAPSHVFFPQYANNSWCAASGANLVRTFRCYSINGDFVGFSAAF